MPGAIVAESPPAATWDGGPKIATKLLALPDEKAAHETPPLSPARMTSVAKQIGDALNASLRESETVFGVNLDRPKELARQRALVWALKDLARQLYHMGYDMRRLYDLTDDMAREIGLPVQQPPKDEGVRGT